MSALGVIAALVLVLAAGFGLALLLGGETSKFAAVELAALSWLLGSAFVTLATFLLGQLVSGFSLQSITALGCLFLALLGRNRAKGRVKPLRFPQSRLELSLLALLAAQIVYLCWFASRQSFGWDGLMIWDLKARAAFFNGGVPPAHYYSDPSCHWSQPTYPLFLPLLESWIYTWLGFCSQSLVRVIFPFFYAAGVAILGTGVARLTGRSWLGFVAAALPFFLPFNLMRDGGLIGGYADFPLGVFYLTAVVFLLRYLRSGAAGDLRCFAAFSAGLPWIKTEGSILWLCLALIGAAFSFPKLRARSLLVALPGLVTWGIWACFKGWMHVPPYNAFMPVTPSNFLAHADRILPVIRATTTELGNLDHWSVLWFGVAAAAIALVITHRTRVTMALVAAVLVPIALETTVYFFSAQASFLAHLLNSYCRLLLQVAPAGIVLVALAIHESLSNAGILPRGTSRRALNKIELPAGGSLQKRPST